MGVILGILIIIIMGIIYSRIAGFIGSNIFKFSEIFKFLQKFFRKSKDN